MAEPSLKMVWIWIGNPELLLQFFDNTHVSAKRWIAQAGIWLATAVITFRNKDKRTDGITPILKAT